MDRKIIQGCQEETQKIEEKCSENAKNNLHKKGLPEVNSVFQEYCVDHSRGWGRKETK